MTSLYPLGASHILGKSAQVNMLTDTIKVLFYAGSYTSTNEYVADLTGASIVARSGALAGMAITNGVVSCNNVTLTAVSGSAFTHVILYKDTGADATSVLIAIFDITLFTPSGGDVNVVFNASGLFSIA